MHNLMQELETKFQDEEQLRAKCRDGMAELEERKKELIAEMEKSMAGCALDKLDAFTMYSSAMLI